VPSFETSASTASEDAVTLTGACSCHGEARHAFQIERLAANDLFDACSSTADAYSELKRLAAIYLRRERSDHTLQVTALVHEAYLRLAGQPADHWQDRAHFLAGAARVMRRILTDHARRHRALKRGAGRENLRYDDFLLTDESGRHPMHHLDEALIRLTAFAPRQAQVVELRFFGGMTEDEIATHLGVCSRTIKRDWTIAKAWLHAELAP